MKTNLLMLSILLCLSCLSACGAPAAPADAGGSCDLGVDDCVAQLRRTAPQVHKQVVAVDGGVCQDVIFMGPNATWTWRCCPGTCATKFY